MTCDLDHPLYQNFPALPQKEIIERGMRRVLGNVNRAPLSFERGRGLKLWDADGKEFLDFIAGIAVCAFGHAPPFMAEALKEQAQKLVHTSNLFWNEPMVLTAELLTSASGLDRAFFSNSGAEANEAAIKMAKKWGSDKSGGKRTNIVSALNSFHGRTMGAISVTGQTNLHQGFHPLMPGVSFVEYGNIAELKEAVNDGTAALILEPVQGEGGVLAPPEGYLREAAELVRSRGGLLIFDEIQTGLGRTGKDFAFRHSGVTPDILTLGKALGCGYPIGATLSTEEAGAALSPGSHSTTMGGAPLAMALAFELCSRILDPEFLRTVEETGAYFKAQLEKLPQEFPEAAKEVRGLGLLLGLELRAPSAPYSLHLRDQGFLVNATATTVLRFAPPLIVSKAEIGQLMEALRKSLREVRAE
jgi:predicted acetylornithine/succinylornithine family transaminase